jgi:hypothetical protein
MTEKRVPFVGDNRNLFATFAVSYYQHHFNKQNTFSYGRLQDTWPGKH